MIVGVRVCVVVGGFVPEKQIFHLNSEVSNTLQAEVSIALRTYSPAQKILGEIIFITA